MSEINFVITTKEKRDLKQVCGDSPSGLILLGALLVGPVKKYVCRVTGLSRSELEPYWSNYADNGVFTYTKVCFDDGDGSPEQAYLGFCLACACGDGWMEFVSEE